MGWVSGMGVMGGPERAGQRDIAVGAGFEAVFLDPVGQVVQQRWADAAVAVAFEGLDPVSAFPVVPGRRWGPGLWWSATTCNTPAQNHPHTPTHAKAE